MHLNFTFPIKFFCRRNPIKNYIGQDPPGQTQEKKRNCGPVWVAQMSCVPYDGCALAPVRVNTLAHASNSFIVTTDGSDLSPSRLPKLLLDVPLFIQIHDEHGGPAWINPPSRIRRTDWMAFTNPILRYIKRSPVCRSADLLLHRVMLCQCQWSGNVKNVSIQWKPIIFLKLVGVGFL